MTDYNSVAAQVSAVSGLSEEQLQAYSADINSAIEYGNSLLKDEKDENDVRVINLCAVYAAMKIALITEINSGDILSFSAGDVSFTKDASSAERLKLLFSIAMQECSGLLSDGGFSFRAV